MDRTLITHSYAEMLRGSFKSLGYFIDEALSSEDTHTFFRIIADSIVPLIRRGPTFESLYLEWIKEKAAYKTSYARTEEAAINEIGDAFEEIKLSLIEQGLIENSTIHASISSIEDVLEFREVYAMPRHYSVAYERLAQLLNQLLTHGRENLVRKYAEIQLVEKSHLDPKTPGSFD